MGHNHGNLHRRRDAKPFDLPFKIRNPFAQPEPQPQQTVVSVVYVTASPTFTGAIGGYSTVGVAVDTEDAPATTATKAKTSDKVVADSTKAHTTLVTSKTSLPSSINSPTSTLASTIPILAATGAITSGASSRTSATLESATSTPSSAATSSGMSTGGKAGLAIGILLLIGAVLSLVLFCFKKRKDAAKHEQLQDEKHEFANVSRHASTRTTATAPRLSLRPITQFIPNLAAEKRASRGNALNTVAENRPTTGQSNNRENPFGNHAETIDTTNARGPEVVRNVRASDIAGAVLNAGDAAAAAAPVTLKRSASKRENAPKPMDFTKSGPFMGPPSPAASEFSVSSETTANPIQTGTGAAIAAAGGPANSAVHRVQLDFKPSMEDELELRAGQLIRLLHEYDDGWALCIRLDRSQQGVVPRTCLSTRPVKPRPQNPRGPPPGARGQGPQVKPQSPNFQRPMTPNGQRPMTPNGRPMTPTGQPPMSPQQSRSRSNSAAQTPGRRNTPPGPSPMNPQQFEAGSPPQGSQIGRKPVPGQAL